MALSQSENRSSLESIFRIVLRPSTHTQVINVNPTDLRSETVYTLIYFGDLGTYVCTQSDDE